MADLSEFHSKSFLDHLHSSFRARAGDSAEIPLRLTEVSEPPTSPNIELFSLFFVGPPAPLLPQGMFHLEHEKMGAFDLFMTAISGDSQGVTYQAVFHRVRKKQP